MKDMAASYHGESTSPVSLSKENTFSYNVQYCARGHLN